MVETKEKSQLVRIIGCAVRTIITHLILIMAIIGTQGALVCGTTPVFMRQQLRVQNRRIKQSPPSSLPQPGIAPPPSNSATELSVKVFPVVSLEAVRDCGRCLLCGLQEAITAPCIH